MKNLTITLTILCAFAALVYAGPEQLSSGKEMKQVATAPAPACPNWAGFYIGGFGGYKYGSNDITLDLGGDWDQRAPQERDALEAAASRDLNTSGAELGGLLGFNWQFNNWVFGVEASGGYLWLRDSNQLIAGVINDYDVRTSLKTHYLSTIAPRFGYAMCRWLPYVTGGVAIGDIDFDQSFFTGGRNPGFGQGGSQSETQIGWMVGGGLEYALTDHWRMRGQYQYIDLGCVDFNTTFNVQPTFTGNHEACLQEHNVSFAIIYGF